MSRARPHGAADAMVGAGGVFTLVAGMSIISPDVRTQVNAFAGDPAVHLSGLASRAMDYGTMLARTFGDYTPDSTPFMGFAIIAVFLTFMMARS
jgi:hypothetical protein